MTSQQSVFVMSPIIQSMCRETINITKRILLRGSGQLGDTKIDQRANCPTFRIGRSAVITNIEMDMTGFREAILITGTEKVCPVLQNCSFRYVIYWFEHNFDICIAQYIYSYIMSVGNSIIVCHTCWRSCLCCMKLRKGTALSSIQFCMQLCSAK